MRHEFHVSGWQGLAMEHPLLFAYVREGMKSGKKKFLLLGDNGHNDSGLQEFLNSPALAALVRQSEISTVCLEMPREEATVERMELYRDALQEGSSESVIKSAGDALWKSIKETRRDYFRAAGIDDEVTDKYMNYWHPRLAGFMAAGLRTVAVDSWKWAPEFLSATEEAEYERVFLGDREVAGYIKQQAGQGKTAVIYGAHHLKYEGTLRAHLAPESSIHIDIFSDRKTYVEKHEAWKTNADFLPDRVYLISEKALEHPDPALYRFTENRLDDRMQKHKEKIAQSVGAGLFSPGNNEKKTMPAEYIRKKQISPVRY